MVEVARRALDGGSRVWWLALPNQRGFVLRRVTEGGYTALGLEVMSAQQAFYRILTRAESLQPLTTGNARLVRVAQALAEVAGALPLPGEARLFSYAIAEAKRFGLGPSDIAEVESETDPEIARLALVFGAYERALADSWDYDDVRSQAAALLIKDPEAGAAACEADVIIVDGMRELGPLELRLLTSLARHRQVHLTLPEAPSGMTPTRTLPPPVATGRVERYLAPNPVAELRFVMNSLKRDLFEARLEPLDLALIVPPGLAPAALVMAEEYGVPLMDESPRALADVPGGRQLLDLIELAAQPTASRLLAVPELAPLANAALQAGVSGADAIRRLAAALGLAQLWEAWSSNLTAHGDLAAWADWLVREVLPRSVPGLPAELQRTALALAQEAQRLGPDPEGFQAWWAALLRDTRSQRRERGGVALTSATQASGRRFVKAYIVGATEGVYRAFESEDYFVPEERRLDIDVVMQRLGLPRRLQGRDPRIVDELLQRADALVITAAEADQAGPLTPAAGLLGTGASPLPAVPIGSRLELHSGEGYRPSFGKVSLPPSPAAELLRQYDVCAFRAWGERALGEQRAAATWSEELRLALLARSKHAPDDLAELSKRFPQAATWLARHEGLLGDLTFRAVFRGHGVAVRSEVDAGLRRDVGSRGRSLARLYHLVAPDPLLDWNRARELLRERWSEHWAAKILLEHRTNPADIVEVWVWPLLGDPLRVDSSDNAYVKSKIERVATSLEAAFVRYQRGDVGPTPGYQCSDCPVFDVCRYGDRT